MNKTLLFLLRIGLGGLFVYAGFTKILNPPGFLTDVQNYRLLPYVPAVAFSLYLPWLEILAGVCAIAKKCYPGVLILLLGLILLFSGALISAWVRGLDIACGCFGTENGTANYPGYLGRDLAFLLALGWMISAEFRPRT